MKIPDWDWLKRKMSMDKAETEFEEVLETARNSNILLGADIEWWLEWHKEMQEDTDECCARMIAELRCEKGLLELPEHETEWFSQN